MKKKLFQNYANRLKQKQGFSFTFLLSRSRINTIRKKKGEHIHE